VNSGFWWTPGFARDDRGYTLPEALAAVGPGWHELVQKGWQAVYHAGGQVHQVKEKFGVLRIYFRVPLKEDVRITETVLGLEERSRTICQWCGVEGVNCYGPCEPRPTRAEKYREWVSGEPRVRPRWMRPLLVRSGLQKPLVPAIERPLEPHPGASLEAAKAGVGPGWQDLVAEAWYCITEEGGRVKQVKEKFGTVRIYYDSVPDDRDAAVSERIREISEALGRICEWCGGGGELRDETYAKNIADERSRCWWFKTLCNRHAWEFYVDDRRWWHPDPLTDGGEEPW